MSDNSLRNPLASSTSHSNSTTPPSGSAHYSGIQIRLGSQDAFPMKPAGDYDFAPMERAEPQYTPMPRAGIANRPGTGTRSPRASSTQAYSEAEAEMRERSVCPDDVSNEYSVFQIETPRESPPVPPTYRRARHISPDVDRSETPELPLQSMSPSKVAQQRECNTPVSGSISPREQNRYDVFRRERAAEEAAWDEAAAEVRSSERGGCCQQLGSTMLRVLILMSREWCSSACELLIPIIFVIGSVILWLIFGSTSGDEGHYYKASARQDYAFVSSALLNEMCYNATISDGIGKFKPCNGTGESTEAKGSYFCPVGRGVPEGACISLKGYAAALKVANGYAETTMVSFSLDDLIILQWLNMADNGRTVSAFSYGGRIYFAPKSNEIEGFMQYLNESSELFTLVNAGVFNSMDDVSSIISQSTEEDPPSWAVVQFNSFTEDNFDVTIMVNSSSLPKTGSLTDTWYLGGLSTGVTDLYVSSGYTTLQNMVYQYYMETVLEITPDTSISYTAMPTKAYKTQSFLAYGGQLAPLIIVLGYLYPVSQFTKKIVVEKELRIREAMLIMGLSESIMYLAWFIIYGAWYLVSSLIISVILHFTYLPDTDFGYLYFMFLFFAWSTIALSGCIASLFSTARLAAILAPLIYFVMAIPLFAMQSAPASAKTGIMILSPSAFAVGIGLVFEHEMGGGAKLDSLQYVHDNPNLLIVFVFLFCDILLYLLLMVYFDLVIPKDWGTTKNPIFFIIDPIKYCCCKKDDDDDDDEEDGRAEDGVFEDIDDDGKPTVQIKCLRKKFKRGGKSFLAVNNLCWSLREGEISVLLGHNGAGKSTTMNLMTGMLEADKGDCIIYGRSICHEQRKARQQIGLCPQHNILWPALTVREHLDYYAAIKGLKGSAKDAAVQRLLHAVDLKDKEFYKSSALSGGQKRKLSVAVAFVGGSPLIFLDEPTAGMDVGARRHTWALLRKMAKEHTILLTTHFMDEADLLGDSVAIMSKGRLQCSGSNMYIKSQMGMGFIITMSVVAHVKRQPIEKFIKQYAPEAEAVGSGAGEVAFRLPMKSKETFPEMLAALENESAGLGVNAYSISATTLEEVFLKIAQKDMKEELGEDLEADEKQAATNAVWNVELEERGYVQNWLQFRAMMIKRFWNALRDRRTQFFQIICPVVCVLLAMLLTLVKFFQFPTITLETSMYGATVEIPVTQCSNYITGSQPFGSDAEIIDWSNISSSTDTDSTLMATYNVHNHDRYGALSCEAASSGVTPIDIFYNCTALHEIPLETSNFYSAYFRKVTSKSSMTVKTQVAGLPRTKQQEAVQSSIYAMMIAVIIMVPFSFIPSTFVGWIVRERSCKARHLQNVSGLNFYIYWGSNFLFDLACYIITMFLVIAVFGIFQRTEYIGKDVIGGTIVLFFLYGLAAIAMAYLLSFAFSDYSTAQNVVMLANFIVGFLLVLAISALTMIDSTKKVANVLRWIFRIVPTYCVGEGISNLATMHMMEAFGQNQSCWDMDVLGWVCVYMGIEIPVFLFLTLFIDHPGRRQRSQRLFHNPDAEPEMIPDEDPDVVKERDDVENSNDRVSDLVRVTNLRKVYGNGKVAVRNVTFGVKPGEVFGFLGTNGAGKTTTISILCQEFYPTSGRSYICGHDIVDESRAALRCIGYCPQFDACLDLLTVEEHLYLYAGVRGISSRTKEGVVEGLVKLCGLTEYKDTKSHELSGGNRRKLSVAISLIGGPSVVFLDEPSAGMDPVARRGLWNAVETVADNCAVVLTTHHLEEVEALAHRVAIMVDGSLRCIGDKTYLKTKFGTGFEVTVRVKDSLPSTDAALRQFFNEEFPENEMTEMHAGRYTFQIPQTVKLSTVFASLEDSKEQLRIRDYNVSQTSIEQVFLRISEEAEMKEEEEQRLKMHLEEEKGCCSCRCC